MADALKKGIITRYLLPLVAAYAAGATALGVAGSYELTAILKCAAFAGVAGLAMMMLEELVPRAVKEVIVFWRLKDRLPGCRAFSVIALRDARIDSARLAALLPSESMSAAAQNSLWYRWLKEVEEAPAVADNHRRFLILRECAGLSLLLALVSPLSKLLPGATWPSVLILTASCAMAYLLFAFAARGSGERLVGNVIAIKVAKE